MNIKREIKELLCDNLIGDIRSMIARIDSYREYHPQITVENDEMLANKAMKLSAECDKLNCQISKHHE